MGKIQSATAEVMDIPVHFGGFSAGDETARLSFKVDRAKVSLKQMEAFFCGARLEATLVEDPNAEKDGQGQAAMCDPDDEITSVADCKTFTVGTKKFAAGLTFAVEEIDIGEIGHLAKKVGKLRVQRIGDAMGRKKKGKKAAKSDDGE